MRFPIVIPAYKELGILRELSVPIQLVRDTIAWIILVSDRARNTSVAIFDKIATRGAQFCPIQVSNIT